MLAWLALVAAADPATRPEVLVATRALDPGTTVAAADVAVAPIDPSLVHTGQLRLPEEAVGMVVAYRILAGEPIRRERLSPRRGPLASTIGVDRQAIYLPLDHPTGLFQPGTLVDLAWFGERAGCFLVERASVVGVENQGALTATEGGVAGGILLGMTPLDAAALVWAKERGRVVPVVRAHADTEPLPPELRCQRPEQTGVRIALGRGEALEFPATPDSWVVGDPGIVEVERMGETRWLHLLPRAVGTTTLTVHLTEGRAPSVYEITVAPAEEASTAPDLQLSISGAAVIPVDAPEYFRPTNPDLVSAQLLDPRHLLVVGRDAGLGRTTIAIKDQGAAPRWVTVEVGRASPTDDSPVVLMRAGRSQRVRLDGDVGAAVVTEPVVVAVDRVRGATVKLDGLAGGRATLVALLEDGGSRIYRVVVAPEVE